MVSQKTFWKSVYAALAAVLLIAPAHAALTQPAIQKLITEEKNWTNRSGLSVVFNGGEVVVGTYREAHALDNDIKIDSILIARKIMEADPDVKRVKMRFYDPVSRKSYQQIDVRESDIKAYSQGLVTKDALLAGIDITRGQDAAEIVEGPFATERLAAKRQIDSFRQQGCGVAPFLKLHGSVEDLARETDNLARSASTPAATVDSSKAALRTALDELIARLDAQNDAVKKIKDRQAAEKRAIAAAAAARQVAAVGTTKPPPGNRPTIEVDAGSGLANLGPFTPWPGPLLLDRLQIGAKIYQGRKSNVPMEHLIPIWVRMEKSVKQKDEAGVKNDVEYLQKSLGLQPVTDEERRGTTVIKTTPF